MDYDDWIAAGNGARKDESLADSIARTVRKQYESYPSVCPDCRSGNIDKFNNHLWKCNSCGHYWSNN